MLNKLQNQDGLPSKIYDKTITHQIMKISARNTLKGTVKSITMGAVNAEVTLEIAPGIEIVSIITKASVESLDLAEGKDAYAVIKSSEVMVAVD